MTIALSDVLLALENVVGANNLLTRPDDMLAYETSARGQPGRAAFVVRPESTEQVSQVMALAAAHGFHLIPQGANTGLVNGSTPDMSGTQGVLSLERMRRILSIDPVNRTAEVEAGVRLSQLNAALAEHGLFFPIDLGADPMIGGMVSTNTGGARFLRYGDVRRNTLGLQLVLPDHSGTIVSLGSDLRKDNSAPDLKHLFIGSCGLFGIVTRAILELHRKPRQAAAALLVPRDDGAILQLLETFEAEAGDVLSAFELMSREAMQAAFEHAASLRNPFAHGALPETAILVELSTSQGAQEGGTFLNDRLENILAAAWEAPGAPLLDAIVGSPEALWTLRHALSEGVKAAGDLVAFDLSFNRSNVTRFRAAMRTQLKQRHPEIRICDFGHIGDGGLHFNCVFPRSGAAALSQEEKARFRQETIQSVVAEFGGSFSAEHGIGRSNLEFYRTYTSPVVQLLASKVQSSIGAEQTHMS
jgi:FAD/FMN-containing dehydrogenase